ncbi:hypothetical protein DE146DRAFT_751013 [Phaeosphaeria sp. MPI-PUGE-AT-0046c]|nr:hypothetical protein DE146DRAFT_751013 [Phaeosphaeria sp. MPI-PUGE-AT-0046c]
MATTTGSSGSGEPDMALIGELLEEISRSPPAVGARKLLVEHYIAVGWLEAATENAKSLMSFAPYDPEVAQFLQLLQRKPDPPAPEKRPVATPSAVKQRMWDPVTGRYTKAISLKVAHTGSQVSTPVLGRDLEPARQELTQGYQALRTKAKFVLTDLLNLQKLQKKAGLPTSNSIAKIRGLAEGGKGSPIAGSGPPGSARSVVRTIRDSQADAASIANNDLEHTMNWTRSPHGRPSGADNDAVRDVLVKRIEAVGSSLPDELRIHYEVALMHLEHEHLQRNYVNTETMLGDEVKDIPRDNFYATEDNYAWDMDELVQAVKANSGVFRNPLSKEMFTPKDVKGILLHPLGKSLAALGVEQHQMSKGIRKETILQMENLSRILLEDQSADTIPSRAAVDEFLTYVATLPELEQKAIEHLKCPAQDSHTGQSYDFSIGEAVRDAKGNRVCFHKTGDFIKQAAAHLRQNQGAAPDHDADKCCTM